MGEIALDDLMPLNQEPPKKELLRITVRPKGGTELALDEIMPANTPEPPKEKKPPDTYRQMDVDNENQMLGSSQWTSPRHHEYKGKELGEATQNELDEVGYKGPKGEFMPTNNRKHVVLRDPEDGKYKVYDRSKETDEGPILGRVLGMGRFLNQGMMAPGLTVAGEAPDVAGAALRQGIKVPRAISKPDSWMGDVVSKVPFAGRPLQNAAAEVGPQIARRAGQVAEDVSPAGEALNARQAGEAAAKDLTEYAGPLPKGQQSVLDQRVEIPYNRLNAHLTAPANAANKGTSDLPNTLREVTKLEQKYADAGLSDKFAKSLETVMGPVTKPGGLGFDDLKFVRTRVGQMIEQGALEHGVSNSELKQIYGALTDDMRALVSQKAGPKGVAAWEKAEDTARQAATEKEGLIKGLGLQTKSEEQIFGKIGELAGSKSQANIKLLANAKRAMTTDGWQSVQSGMINRMGRTVTAEGAHFDPTKFVKDWAGMSDEGKTLLFGAKGSNTTRSAIDDLVTISQRWPKAKHMSGGATSGHGLMSWGTLAAFEGWQEIKEIFKGEHGLVRPTVALTAMAGNYGLAKWLSTPGRARAAARWAAAGEDLVKTPKATALAKYNRASQALAKDMEGELDSNQIDLSVELMRAIAKNYMGQGTPIGEGAKLTGEALDGK